MINKNCKEKVWKLADHIKDPNMFRQDPYGNQICHNCYGKDTPQGWNIDHIKPKNKGRSDCIRSLHQAI